MPDYTKFLPYFVELDRICIEKNFDNKTIKALKQWFLYILNFYKPSNDILEHFSVEDYIRYSFEKLKQTKDIKILELSEILINPNYSLFKQIKKIPFNTDKLTTRFIKQGKGFILDKNGECYLSASGVCRGGKIIELLNEKGLSLVLQHELQHINQNYVYPSEFPFSNDMLQMLNEGEGEYHYHLLDMISDFFQINEKDSYYIYYLVYTILMLTIPKEIRDSWNKIDSVNSSSYVFSDIFKDIFNSEENRNNFSYIFALATLIVASCNPENTKETFNNSIEASINRCSEKVDRWNQIIAFVVESDRKNNRESLQYHIEEVSKRIKILQDPDLLREKYNEIITEEKEFITSEPQEKQEKLLQELQLFTLEKFEFMLKEKVQVGEESIRKYQNKQEQTPQEILEENDYKKYQYYQYGWELSKKMQILLSQELSFTELFELFLEKVESYLIDRKDFRLEEKLSFIDKIRNNCLVNSKKI